jgi:FkbM family methyltransferase
MYSKKVTRAIVYLQGWSYFAISKIFSLVGYFPGSSKIQNVVIGLIPLWKGCFAHPIGFLWNIKSLDSLRTFLTSCEPFTTTLITSQANEFDTFICIGANRGWYPLVATTKNTNIKVIAFECNSSIFKELEQNILINRRNVKLLSTAIGSQNTTLKLYMPHDGNEGMSTLFPIREPLNNADLIETVLVTTLDDALKSEFETIGKTLLLMDIEGSEMLALQGAKKFLELTSPTIILEINSKMLQAAGTSAHSLFSYMESQGYQIFWIDERERLIRVTDINVVPHSNSLPSGTGANYLFTKQPENWLKWLSN